MMTGLILLRLARNVVLGMVDGKVTFKDGHFTNVDVADTHTRLQAAMADALPTVQMRCEGKV